MNYLTRFGSGKPTEEQIIQNAQDTVKELKVVCIFHITTTCRFKIMKINCN